MKSTLLFITKTLLPTAAAAGLGALCLAAGAVAARKARRDQLHKHLLGLAARRLTRRLVDRVEDRTLRPLTRQVTRLTRTLIRRDHPERDPLPYLLRHLAETGQPVRATYLTPTTSCTWRGTLRLNQLGRQTVLELWTAGPKPTLILFTPADVEAVCLDPTFSPQVTLSLRDYNAVQLTGGAR